MRRAATPQESRSRLGFLKPPKLRRGVRVPARSVPLSGEYAALGLTAFASRSEVKHAYKRLALKYHPDVIRGECGVQEKEKTFKDIKSAYESLMAKFDQEEEQPSRNNFDDEWDDWDEWMGFEGGINGWALRDE